MRTRDLTKGNIIKTRPRAFHDCKSSIQDVLTIGRTDNLCSLGTLRNGLTQPFTEPISQRERKEAHETTMPLNLDPTLSSLINPSRDNFFPEQRRGSQWSKSYNMKVRLGLSSSRVLSKRLTHIAIGTSISTSSSSSPRTIFVSTRQSLSQVCTFCRSLFITRFVDSTFRAFFYSNNRSLPRVVPC